MKKQAHLLSYIFLLFSFSVISILPSCKSRQDQGYVYEYKPVPPVKPEKSTDDEKEVTEVKKRDTLNFEVALIMPFELKENLGSDVDTEADPNITSSGLPALHFYEGALMAVDSLNTHGKKVTIRAYETPKDSIGLLRIVNNKSFGNPDLIIATLPNSMVNEASGIAQRRKLNILFTQASSSDFLSKSSNCALAYTSTISQCRQMVHLMKKNESGSNVILVYRTSKREDELAKVFRDEINKSPEMASFHEFNASVKDTGSFHTLISSTVRNVVYVVSSDEAFVSSMVTLLNNQEVAGIKVCGLPTWQNFESINFMAFPNLEVLIFENNFIDYSIPEVNDLRRKFIGRFYCDPLPAAFNGFKLIYQVGMHAEEKHPSMGDLLKSSFNRHQKDYRFEPVNGGGYENMSISLLRFHDYKLERITTD